MSEQQYELSPLMQSDVSAIMQLQERMLASLPDPRWYFVGSAQEMEQELAAGFGVCVRDGDHLAAIGICRWGEQAGDHSYALLTGAPSAEHTMDFLDVMVDVAWRRKGIHSAFLRYFRELAFKHGCTAVYCTVDPENTPSRSSFEKAGFLPVCCQSAYDGRPRVFYRLDL